MSRLKLKTEIRFQISAFRPLKKKEALYGQFVIKKPDLDNLVKMVCDYLIQVAYEDDNLVAEISAKKIYDKNPRTEIFIEVLE